MDSHHDTLQVAAGKPFYSGRARHTIESAQRASIWLKAEIMGDACGFCGADRYGSAIIRGMIAPICQDCAQLICGIFLVSDRDGIPLNDDSLGRIVKRAETEYRRAFECSPPQVKFSEKAQAIEHAMCMTADIKGDACGFCGTNRGASSIIRGPVTQICWDCVQLFCGIYLVSARDDLALNEDNLWKLLQLAQAERLAPSM